MKTVVCFGLVLSALCAAGEVLLTEPGERVTIKCGVSSSSWLQWMHRGDVVVAERNGFPLKGSAKMTSRSKLKGTSLEISAVTEDDAGTFTCNAGGTPHQHTLIVVSTSVSPSADLELGSAATLQCRVKGLSPDPTVEWERPNGSPGGLQTVQLQSVTHSDKGQWVCKFSYNDQVYRSKLDVRVKESTIPPPTPFHKTDILPESACRDCTGPQSPNTPLPLLLGLSWWMWVILGACVLVLFVLIVCIIVLCKRMRNQKQKQFEKVQLPQPRQYCQCARPTAATAPRHQGRRREKAQTPLMA